MHWWEAKDFPHGPFWVVACNEAVRLDMVGVVYMYSLEDMTKTPEGAWEFTNIPLRLSPTHMHFILVPDGFHGFQGPHWDLRVQFTSHDDHMTDSRFGLFSFIPCLDALDAEAQKTAPK